MKRSTVLSLPPQLVFRGVMFAGMAIAYHNCVSLIGIGRAFLGLLRGTQKLMVENLKVFWAEFSTLSQTVLLCMQLNGIYKDTQD
jgi:hypothetical protein